MQRLVFSDGSYAAEITKHDLVGMCRQFAANGGAPTSSGPPVPVGNSCDVLAHWNGREALGSRGAVLFRRFWDLANGAEPTPYSHPFDSNDPVHTPYGLDTNNPQVQQAFGDALSDLRDAHVPFNARLGSQQFMVKAGHRIPYHGGTGDPHGDFDAIWTTWVAGKGLSQPDGGSSFVQVVTWNDGPCPDARTILTYGESENPASPHFVDQSRLFSRKRWVLDRFCQAQIQASPALHVTTLTAN
jgi:acyl-homoserine-lactone acylase